MTPEDRGPPADDEIAADDAGGSILGRKTGQTAGGAPGFAAASGEQERPQGDIAADDAGGTAEATQAVERTQRED